MKIPVTLSVYIGKKFLSGSLLVFATLMGIIFLFDFVELMRRGLLRDVPIGIIIELGLLKLPKIGRAHV